MDTNAHTGSLAGIALPESARLFHTCAVDDAEARVADVFCEHRLRVADGRGGVDASMYYVPFGGIGVGVMRYGASVTIDVRMLGDFILVQMPLRGREVVTYGRDTVCSDARVASVVGWQRPLRMLHEAGTEKLFVRIDKETLNTRCRQLLGADMKAPVEFQLGMALAGTRSLSWRRLLGWLCEEAARSGEGGLLSSTLFATQVEQLVVAALLMCQPNNYQARLLADGVDDAPRSVRLAQRYIDDHAHEAITIGDIAVAAGLGARALFVNFRRHRGTTPMHYLKQVRLARVRDELLQSTAKGTTVTDVALRWGFTHLGHFTADFKARYGELPSSVLDR